MAGEGFYFEASLNEDLTRMKESQRQHEI